MWPDEREDKLSDLDLIMKDYVQKSPALGDNQDAHMVSRYAEAVYNYRLAHGISTRQILAKEKSRFSCQTGKLIAEFSDEKHTEYEKDVPIWEIDLYELDLIFDEIRFSRHLTSNADPYFKRRSTWLYPIDGNYEFATRFSQYINM